MNVITRSDLSNLFSCVADVMTEKSDELGAMDALLGDGDLGLTMKKGFCALPKIIDDISETDISKTIMKAGMKLSSIIPSTMGFLMGSGLMAGGKAISGAEIIDAVEYAVFLRGFADGIVKRGKCTPGDRTVLDAIDAAAKTAEAYLQCTPDATLVEVTASAKEGAENGMEATRGMEPKFGKAAVHKNAAIGTIDQGAYAGFCLISAIHRFVESNNI